MGLDKKFYISVAVVLVVSMALGFVIHGLLLQNEYAQLPNIMRPEDDAGKYFHFMIIAHILFALGFTWIYRMGRQDKPWLGQGVRFGIAVAVMSSIPFFLIYHAVAFFPLMLALKQALFESIGMIILGASIAFIHK
ncbi:MAG: hypothetical protein MJA83_00835 [Gammaproteobacteria bacterium]|nr:hypothetical protein [Gammaproteobacteria bacterium]